MLGLSSVRARLENIRGHGGKRNVLRLHGKSVYFPEEDTVIHLRTPKYLGRMMMGARSSGRIRSRRIAVEADPENGLQLMRW